MPKAVLGVGFIINNYALIIPTFLHGLYHCCNLDTLIFSLEYKILVEEVINFNNNMFVNVIPKMAFKSNDLMWNVKLHQDALS